MSSKAGTPELRALKVLSMGGLTLEAMLRLVALYAKYAEFEQMAPNWSLGTLIDIPVAEIVAAVGMPGLPDRDASAIARVYFLKYMRERVRKNTFVQVDILVNGDISIILSPGGYRPGNYRPDGMRDTLASSDYRTYNLQPVAVPPAKRARRVKNAETSPEPVTPAEIAALADGE